MVITHGIYIYMYFISTFTPLNTTMTSLKRNDFLHNLLLNCLFNRLMRLTVTTTLKLRLRIVGPYSEGNPNMIRGLLSQRTRKVGSIFMSWRHKWCITLIPKEYCSARPVFHPVVYSIRTTGEWIMEIEAPHIVHQRPLVMKSPGIKWCFIYIYTYIYIYTGR